jgi:hypothetical protein
MLMNVTPTKQNSKQFKKYLIFLEKHIETFDYEKILI